MMNTAVMCAKCGVGYYLVAPVQTQPCELCGEKEGAAVYDLNRSDLDDEREESEREPEGGAG
jgi:hypothetical protein